MTMHMSMSVVCVTRANAPRHPLPPACAAGEAVCVDGSVVAATVQLPRSLCMTVLGALAATVAAAAVGVWAGLCVTRRPKNIEHAD